MEKEYEKLDIRHLTKAGTPTSDIVPFLTSRTTASYGNTERGTGIKSTKMITTISIQGETSTMARSLGSVLNPK
jgi:hypothetical protein